VLDPGHPVMEGITSFDGGSSSFPAHDPVADPGGHPGGGVGDGAPLVAVKQIGGVRRVDLGFFPPSSDVSFDFWRVGTDGDLLMANASNGPGPAPAGSPPNPKRPPSRGREPGGRVTFDASGLYGGGL